MGNGKENRMIKLHVSKNGRIKLPTGFMLMNNIEENDIITIQLVSVDKQ